MFFRTQEKREQFNNKLGDTITKTRSVQKKD